MRVQPSLRKGTIVPGVILGLVIGLAVAAFIAWTWNREPSYNERVLSDQERARSEREHAAKSGAAKDTKEGGAALGQGAAAHSALPMDPKAPKAGEPLSPQDRERFDFYKILPGIEEARPVTEEDARRGKEGQSVDEILKGERELEKEIKSLKETPKEPKKKKRTSDDEDQLNQVIEKIQDGSSDISEPVPSHHATKTSKRILLQAGAFEREEEADRLKADLAMSGLEVRVQKHRDAEGQMVYRVRLGPYSDENDIAKVRSELRRQGIKPTSIPVKEE